MDKKALEETSKEYKEKIAKARNKKERDKLIGELLERLVYKIFREKGSIPQRNHKVSDRRHADVDQFGFTMEIGNTIKYQKSGKLVQYPKTRLKSALRHFEKDGYPDRYYLIGFKSALESCREELEKRNVKILEIGSQVTPENLVDIYPRVVARARELTLFLSLID